MSATILVYLDQIKGQALPASWEALGAAHKLAGELGGEIVALAIGAGAQDVAGMAFQYGADAALYAADASLADYRGEPYAAILTQVAKEQDPAVILFPTTTRGRELAALAAVDLETGVMPDATALEVQDGQVIVTRPVYAGKLIAKTQASARPAIIALRGRAFDKPAADAAKSGTPTQVAPALAAGEIQTEVLEYAASEGGVALSDAAVVVSGGRGLANNPKVSPPGDLDEKQAEIWTAQQGFEMLGELAETLNAAIGASRAAVDAGYIPYEHQVGQTGKVVTPDLYIACGISGAIQHLAGMRSSKVIVAINKDPDAPIFKLARFGVVGDVFDIVPPLTQALKARLGK